MVGQSRGWSETVYALRGTEIASGSTHKHDTEDVAARSFRFSNGAVVCVSALRGVEPYGWDIRFLGERGTVSVTPREMRVRSFKGDRKEKCSRRRGVGVGPDITAFGAACRSGAEQAVSTAEQHVPTLAVIEAGYLSAKT